MCGLCAASQAKCTHDRHGWPVDLAALRPKCTYANRILSSLDKPYCYLPPTTFFSFVENRWVGMPPEQDKAEVTREYLDELIEAEDCRLDKLSRDENVQAKLEQTGWDVIVVDEAHKMSASFFSGEVKTTERYRLAGQTGSGLSVQTAFF